jgi:hypothetical protein
MKLATASVSCLFAALSWMGCGVDSMSAPDPGDETGPVTEVSGHIAASTSWQDTIHITGSVTIDAGATVTVLPGTKIAVTTSKGVAITVLGTLDVQGTKASPAVIRPAVADEFWSDTSVAQGGTMKASYLVQTGGGISIVAGAKVTLVDTQLSHSPGDFLVMSGGTLDMSYSAIGLELGQRDTTHCDLHVAGPITLTVTHSNISTSAYGIMFYGGINADFTYDNWFGNGIDVERDPTPVTGDFSHSYFARGAPAGPGLSATSMATSRVADAGVR